MGRRIILLTGLVILISLIQFSGCDSGETAAPLISLVYEDKELTSGEEVALGSCLVGNNKCFDFTIRNGGGSDLLLTDESIISISGTDASAFSLQTKPVLTIPAGKSSHFSILFSPENGGDLTAQIGIASNDTAASGFSLTLLAAAAPEALPSIEVFQNDVEIEYNAATMDFQKSTLGIGTVKTFTIINSGYDDLLLSGPPAIAGLDAACFAVTSAPLESIAAGGSTTFDITYSPDAVDSDYAYAEIISNDPDFGSYNFFLQGAGVVPDVEVAITGPGISDSGVADGQTKIASLVFGMAVPIYYTVTITNTDEGLLLLSGDPAVSCATIEVVEQPAVTELSQGDSIEVTIVFNGASSGYQTFNIEIETNDPDIGLFNFTLGLDFVFYS